MLTFFVVVLAAALLVIFSLSTAAALMHEVDPSLRAYYCTSVAASALLVAVANSRFDAARFLQAIGWSAFGTAVGLALERTFGLLV